MYAVSAEYKDWILNNTGTRVFYIRATLSTPYGDISLTDADFVIGSVTMNEAVVSNDMIEIGSVFASDLSMTIFNNEASYAIMSMRGSRVFVEVGYVLEDASTEWVPLGRFIVTESSMPTNTITLKCLDYMLLFERPWADVTLAFPATISQIIAAICLHCGVTSESTVGITNISYNVAIRPTDTTLTCRDILSYCAAICGRNARMTRTGTLELTWYGDTRCVDEYTADGNTAILDGGVPGITNYAVFDGGYQAQPAAAYTLAPGDRASFNLDSAQIVITGLLYKAESADYLIGSPQYAIKMEMNPLLKTDISATLTNIWNAIGWLSYAPYSSTVFADPARQAGDLVDMTDAAGKTYSTIVTSQSYTFRGTQTLTAVGRVLEAVDYLPGLEKKLIQVEIDQKTLAPSGLIEVAKLGNTIIDGGYIKTDLIDVETLVAGRIAYPTDPTVSWATMGSNGAKHGVQLFKHSVSDSVPFASIACGSGAAADPTVHFEYLGVEIASFTNAAGWWFGDGVRVRLNINPNGDIILYDEDGHAMIWADVSADFIQLHSPSATDNAIGVDATGAYKITGGVKAYL